MKKGIKIINSVLATFIMLVSFSLVGCNSTPDDNTIKEYTIIWQNDNGDILELDRKVQEGTLPTYDSELPTKESDDPQYYYVFDKWEPEVKECYYSEQYTATYKKIERTFTVTWTNDDGTIIEVDHDVKYGSMPIYNSELPQKNDGENQYIFYGWSPILAPITEDTTFVATYFMVDSSEAKPGVSPVLRSDEAVVEYGYYPQNVVTDSTLIAKLDALSPNSEVNNWYIFEDKFYTKITASTYYDESYTFNNGTAITNGNTYWFSCDTIKWRIKEINNGVFTLLADTLLDTSVYYNGFDDRTIDSTIVHPNNYKYSDVRKFLNDQFFQKAFVLNNTFVNDSTFKYGDENLTDKVYLFSKENYLNSNYGFETDVTQESNTRYCKVSDYARCVGAYVNSRNAKSDILKNNGIYLTRSESDEFTYSNICVNSAGYLSNYSVTSSGSCVRPVIQVNNIIAA